MLKENYRDNPLLKRVGVQINYTKEQFEEYIKCSKDPIYFARYIKIVTLDHGLVPFEMYDYQKDMVQTFHDNRFVITKCPRQVGKTTTAIAYLLWVILFQDSQNIAVLANKGQTARDVLSKLQLAYENLPLWLQQGVVEWNKGKIELENGSKIIASSTSSSAARSGSYNCVDGNSITKVKLNGNILDISLKDLYDLISNSSKYVYNNHNGIDEYAHKQQKMVLSVDEQRLFEYGLCEGVPSYYTEKYGRNRQDRKFNISSNKTSYSSAQTIDQDDTGSRQEEYDICVLDDDSYKNIRNFEYQRIFENERSKKGFYSLEQKEKRNLFRRNFTKNEKCQIESIQILTEDGFKNFDGIKRTKNQKTIKIITENNVIICTPDHKIYTSKGYLEAQYCLNKKVLNCDNHYELVKSIENNGSIDVYDILEVRDTHSYYCNNILVHQCVFLDEFAFVPSNIAYDFFTSVYPVITAGTNTKIIIVSTPNGMNLFYKIWMDAKEKRNNYVPFEIHWSQVPGRDQKWREETIRNTSERQFQQEFECVDRDTLIEIYDKKTKEYSKITIGDFYDFLV